MPDEGRYRITARSGPERTTDAVVLGKPIARRILRLILGVMAFIAGLGLGLLVLAVATGLAIRDRRGA